MTRVFWTVASLAYLCAAAYLLWVLSPPSGCSEGVLATLHWGDDPPDVSWREYRGSFAVRWLFYREYVLAGAALLLFGLILPAIVAGRARPGRRTSLRQAMLALALLWTAVAVVDAGTAAGLWVSGCVFCSEYAARLWVLISTALAMLTFVFAAGDRRLTVPRIVVSGSKTSPDEPEQIS